MPFWAALRAEIQRLQNRHFLEAAMAVCALSALAGGRVTLAERYQVDTLVATFDRLSIYDPHEAIRILDEFIHRVHENPNAAETLRACVHRYAGDEKASRALLRMAYLVVTADGPVGPKEREIFGEMCALLGSDPSAVLADLGDVGT